MLFKKTHSRELGVLLEESRKLKEQIKKNHPTPSMDLSLIDSPEAHEIAKNINFALEILHKSEEDTNVRLDQVFIFRVQTPTSKRSVGGNFESGGVETPSDLPKFQLAETSSLVTTAIQVGLWDMTVIAGDPVNPNNEFIIPRQKTPSSIV